jgi:hypothetical protein
LWSNASEIAAGFLKFDLYQCPPQEQKRGGVMNIENNTFPEPQGFSIQDILWAVGVWSVILTLSPVIIFYMLMVA